MNRKYKALCNALLSLFVTLSLLFSGIGLAPVAASPSTFASATTGNPIGPGEGGINISPLPGAGNDTANANTLQKVLQIVFGIAGALALLVITVAGLRYVTAAGDPQQMTGAKNAIVYALVGLLVAMFAEAIVSFVVGNL